MGFFIENIPPYLFHIIVTTLFTNVSINCYVNDKKASTKSLPFLRPPFVRSWGRKITRLRRCLMKRTADIFSTHKKKPCSDQLQFHWAMLEKHLSFVIEKVSPPFYFCVSPRGEFITENDLFTQHLPFFHHFMREKSFFPIISQTSCFFSFPLKYLNCSDEASVYLQPT